MENYPENIKDAIDWIIEADLEYVKLQEEWNEALEREYLRITKEKDRYEVGLLTTNIEFEARACCRDLLKQADLAKVEVHRRIRWWDYLVYLHQGTAKNE